MGYTLATYIILSNFRPRGSSVFNFHLKHTTGLKNKKKCRIFLHWISGGYFGSFFNLLSNCPPRSCIDFICLQENVKPFFLPSCHRTSGGQFGCLYYHPPSTIFNKNWTRSFLSVDFAMGYSATIIPENLQTDADQKIPSNSDLINNRSKMTSYIRSLMIRISKLCLLFKFIHKIIATNFLNNYRSCNFYRSSSRNILTVKLEFLIILQ